MALTFLTPTYGGRLGFEAEGRGRIGGLAHARVTRERVIDLANSAYVTGGWTITPALAGGIIPTDALQCSHTIGGEAITPIGIQVKLDFTDPSLPKLMAYYNGSEVSNGATFAGSVAVRFIGHQ